MRHGMDHRKLRRNPSHRKALMRNLMNALVRSERIVTTVAKAKELRRLADRLITLGKRNDTHARRLAFAMLTDKENTDKLFAGLAGRFADRQGGYTRIMRTGYRAGDGSDMAILEYLPSEEKKAGAPKGRRKGAAAAAEARTKPEKKQPAAKRRPRPARKAGDREKTAKEKVPEGKKGSKPGRKETADKSGPMDRKGGVKSAAKSKSAKKPD